MTPARALTGTPADRRNGGDGSGPAHNPGVAGSNPGRAAAVMSQDIGDRSNLRLWVRPLLFACGAFGCAGGLVVAGGVEDEFA